MLLQLPYEFDPSVDRVDELRIHGSDPVAEVAEDGIVLSLGAQRLRSDVDVDG